MQNVNLIYGFLILHFYIVIYFKCINKKYKQHQRTCNKNNFMLQMQSRKGINFIRRNSIN